MKKSYLLCLLSLALLVLGCKKDNDAPIPELPTIKFTSATSSVELELDDNADKNISST